MLYSRYEYPLGVYIATCSVMLMACWSPFSVACWSNFHQLMHAKSSAIVTKGSKPCHKLNGTQTDLSGYLVLFFRWSLDRSPDLEILAGSSLGMEVSGEGEFN
jgi:hypothetical protein